MKDCVLISMAIGIIAGALIVSNNNKAQEVVEKTKRAVKKSIEKMK